jgi:hypothetical protein
MFRKTLGIALTLTFTTPVFAADLSLEPCMNGGVSASGNFPTQEMEEQIYAYRRWASEMPGYLFAFSLESLSPTVDGAPAVGYIK